MAYGLKTYYRLELKQLCDFANLNSLNCPVRSVTWS